MRTLVAAEAAAWNKLIGYTSDCVMALTTTRFQRIVPMSGAIFFNRLLNNWFSQFEDSPGILYMPALIFHRQMPSNQDEILRLMECECLRSGKSVASTWQDIILYGRHHVRP